MGSAATKEWAVRGETDAPKHEKHEALKGTQLYLLGLRPTFRGGHDLANLYAPCTQANERKHQIHVTAARAKQQHKIKGAGHGLHLGLRGLPSDSFPRASKVNLKR